MKHIVCYSGGHSSAIVAIEVARKYGKEDVILLNHDIAARSELADVKRFKKEVADYLGIEITYANHPDWKTKDQFDVCVDAGTFVNPENRTILCTHRLKTKPFYDWMAKNHNAEDVVYYGFDADEGHRITRRVEALGEVKSDYPLVTQKDRTIIKTIEIGIEPPNQYDVLKHANCIGCLKAGWQHWYVIYCYHPEAFKKGKEAEEKIGCSIHKDGYLEDKEYLFEMMRKALIPATEKIPSGKFWATVRRALKGSQISLFDLPEEEPSAQCMGDCGMDRN